MIARWLRATSLAALALVSTLPAVRAQEDRAAALFAQADGLLHMGEDDAALEELERLLAQFPAAEYPVLDWRAAARVRRGEVHWRRSHPELAAADWIHVIDFESPSSWSARARLGLAAVSLAAGDWLGAADQLQRIVVAAETGAPEADPGSADEARRRLALIDRFRLRAAAGGSPWQRARALQPGGLQFERPVALAAAGDGQLLVVDEGMPALLLIDSNHASSTRLAYNEHSRPWWGRDGLPYLATRRAGVIALGGARVGFLAMQDGRPVQLKALEAGGRGPAGAWFLLDANPPRLLAFGPAGAYLGQMSAASEQPVDVAVDALGRVYVLDAVSGEVSRFAADASRDGTAAAGTWRRAEAVAVDGMGNVYVLDRDARTIDVFDAQGQPLWRGGPALPGGVQLRTPRDLDVDGIGRIYVADRGAGTVVVIE